MPVFPPLVALVASIAGYQIPVVCQPLTPGTSTMATIAVSTAGSEPSTTQGTWPNTTVEGGLTAFWRYVPPGSVVTVTVAGQTVTLPNTPSDTPYTDENPPPAGLKGEVAVPVFVAIDQADCDKYTSTSAAFRGRALIVAVHEAMHVRYADGNEALTECRAMKTFPYLLTSLFPSIADPGPSPKKPRDHKALTRWKRAYAAWLVRARPWKAQQALEAAMTKAAQAYDASLPKQYHGRSC